MSCGTQGQDSCTPNVLHNQQSMGWRVKLVEHNERLQQIWLRTGEVWITINVKLTDNHWKGGWGWGEATEYCFWNAKFLKYQVRNTRSLSLISIKKDEISWDKISSIFSGRSTMEYFTAITTVALVNAAGLLIRSYTKNKVKNFADRTIRPKKNDLQLRISLIIPSVLERVCQVQ